jgi:histidinol dehydrogenase
MPHQLDQILISASNPDWHARLREIHTSVRGATYFEDGSEEDSQLNEIIKGVKERKDLALQEYTQRYDGVTLATAQFRVNQQELKKAHDTIDKNLLKLICQSIKNVRKYQEEIFVVNDKSCSNKTGVKYTPIKRVGICVPGAAAPLPSTVIMTVVPAQVAKVKEIAVVSPPRYNNSIHPVILATCFVIGPGNQWVQMAKRKVFGFVDIDSIAGPSEVLIIANDSANPAWVAADMLSQAEHAPGSAVLFTNSEDFAKRTLEELKKQLNQIGRKEPTIKCLLKFGAIIVFEKTDEVITQANFFAAEHLEIQCGNESRKIARKIENAGAIFIGDYSPVAVGDYWAGPSHTLPTGMTAKFFSPLSANDFIKSTSIIEYDKAKFTQSAEDIIRLAGAEGLDAHAKSIKIRQQN